MDILRTFYVTTAKDLAPELQLKDGSLKGNKIILRLAILCSNNLLVYFILVYVSLVYFIIFFYITI